MLLLYTGVLPKYFSSEWSVAQFRLLEGLQYLVAFGHQKNTIVIVGMDGSFYRCEYDPVAGGDDTDDEAQSGEIRPRKYSKRESLSSSDFSLGGGGGSHSHGSFTTYERIPIKKATTGDDEVVTLLGDQADLEVVSLLSDTF